MSQSVIYKGIIVEPVERDGAKICVRTKNAGDAQKAGMAFKSMEGSAAVFEAWALETELVAVN